MNRLLDLTALAIDCQATGANPDRGWLMEVGWAPTSARGNGRTAPRSALILPPEGSELPRRISRVTGISSQDLLEGQPLESVRRSLAGAARRVARANQMSRCPAVIHFARFEKPYLQAMFRRRFPFELFCTHEIARRLLPDLPRRGLRAVAGYFGHSAPELRRAGPHVRATGVIWKSLVEKLSEVGVDTLEDLREWLASTEGPTRCGRAFPMTAELRRDLPDSPGVYRMQRANGDVLYVGKASSVRRRVNSYFHRGGGRVERTLEMLAQARELDVSTTPTCLEAALLESDEIKRISPPYNVALRRRGRFPVFASPDFASFSRRPGADYPWGPFATSREMAMLSALMILAASPARWDEVLADAKLGVSELIGSACRQEGAELFLTRHGLSQGPGMSLRRLLQVGAQLWLRTLSPSEVEKTDAETQEEPFETPAASPETVAASLEKGLARAAHGVRRARWFCWLSEAAIVWRPLRHPDRRRLLVIESGEAEAVWMGSGQSLPAPRRKSMLERQLGIDWARYDRLRVLTSELRRLAKAGRLAEVRLGGRPINGQSLQATLQWL